MVDVGKMIQDGDRSKYITPHQWPGWVWGLIGFLIGVGLDRWVIP